MKKINLLFEKGDDLPFNTNINTKELYDALCYLKSYNFILIKDKLEQYIKFHKFIHENFIFEKNNHEKKYNKMLKNLILYNNNII